MFNFLKTLVVFFSLVSVFGSSQVFAQEVSDTIRVNYGWYELMNTGEVFLTPEIHPVKVHISESFFIARIFALENSSY